MDPNEAHERLSDAMLELARALDRGNDEKAREAAIEVFDHWNALDNWIGNGGFLPEAWEHNNV